MFTQFFGNYLLSQNYVTQEQLFGAMQKQASTQIKLGTLAIDQGLMTASEVDRIVERQNAENRKFGELAIEEGLLTNEQVVDMLKSTSPNFLLIGQILVDDGVITNSDLENIIVNYKSDNEMLYLDMTTENQADLERLYDNFFIMSETPISKLGKMYMELLFNNFIRFVGEDFTPLACDTIDEFPAECCSIQPVNGDYSICSYISMDEATATEFASRYVGDQFDSYDEYVMASLQDFLNLHNGLFIVNCSNDFSLELSIGAPEQKDNEVFEFEDETYFFPILYSFGTVNFIFEIRKTCEI